MAPCSSCSTGGCASPWIGRDLPILLFFIRVTLSGLTLWCLLQLSDPALTLLFSIVYTEFSLSPLAVPSRAHLNSKTLTLRTNNDFWQSPRLVPARLAGVRSCRIAFRAGSSERVYRVFIYDKAILAPLPRDDRGPAVLGIHAVQERMAAGRRPGVPCALARRAARDPARARQPGRRSGRRRRTAARLPGTACRSRHSRPGRTHSCGACPRCAT